ncbi:MAG: DUF2157 domain-containing protein, partial [Propionibacteriaceae bacterium]|nr:DUF2157 domain-containing protein [Propionibacteriaceae bacterium]
MTDGVRYFDPRRCPVCGAARSAVDRCAGCGAVFLDPRIAELGRTLQRADAIRADVLARAARPADPAAETPAPGRHGVPRRRRPFAGGPGPAPRQDPPPPRPQSPSVGWVLLAVGALCLMVAAGIFIAVTWDTLGWLLRGAIMLGVTAVFAATAELTRRRGLRASAEALTGIAGVLWLTTLVSGSRLLPESVWWPPLIGVAVAAAALIADAWHARSRDRLWSVDALMALSVPILFGGFSYAAGDWHPLISGLVLAAGVLAHLRWPTRRLVITRIACLLAGVVAGASLAVQAIAGLAPQGNAADGWRLLVPLAALGVLAARSSIVAVRRLASGLAGALAAGAVLAATSRLPLETLPWICLGLALPAAVVWLWARADHEAVAAGRAASLGWLAPPGIGGLAVVAVTFARLWAGPQFEPGSWWMLSSIGFVGLGLVVGVARTRGFARPLRVTDGIAILGAWTAALVLVYGTFLSALLVLTPVLAALLLLARLTRTLTPVWCAGATAVWLWTLVGAGGWIALAALLVVATAALFWGYAGA